LVLFKLKCIIFTKILSTIHVCVLSLAVLANIWINLCLSHTEHTAYAVGHQCKPYIQPNQTGRIRVTLGPFECIRESSVCFLNLKSWYGCHVRVWSYKRSYKTVAERVNSYETVCTTVPEVHPTSLQIRFQTIATLPLRFKYEWYMVKYGQTRCSTGLYGINVYQSLLKVWTYMKPSHQNESMYIKHTRMCKFEHNSNKSRRDRL